MKNKIVNIIISMLIIVNLQSCKKFIEVPPPADEVIGDAAFSDDATATAAVTGLYTRMMGNAGSGQMTTGGTSVYLGLAADELNFLSTSQSLVLQYQEFFTNSIAATSTNFWPRFWQNPYNFLYHINACIEGLSRTTSLTETLKKQLLGEMKFMRAFIYFYLVNEYGDVPLIVSTDYIANAITPRTPITEVYAQIESDLRQAQELLGVDYPSAGKARPNKLSATALLARIYLYQQKWTDAIAAANEVISSGRYSIVASLNNVFLINSAEAILQFPTSSTSVVNTYDGNLLIPSSSSAIPPLSITNSLYNAFETGDNRKTLWLKNNTVGGQIYYYPFKYKLRTNTTPAAEATVILRLAELYLIRSEALTQNDNTVQALVDLNIVRNRAGLPNSVASTKADILSAIEKERRIELFSEWGHRWLDLKRTNQATAILGPLKGALWQPTDALFPIPDYEINRNSQLVQNPGY